MKIIAVDWAKDVSKRSAYQADTETRELMRLGFDGSLAHLVQLASATSGPVLLAIDAAIGFPSQPPE